MLSLTDYGCPTKPISVKIPNVWACTAELWEIWGKVHAFKEGHKN